MSRHHKLPEPASVMDMYLYDMALSLRDLVKLATPRILMGEAPAGMVELREGEDGEEGDWGATADEMDTDAPPAQPQRQAAPPATAGKPQSGKGRKAAHRDELREGDDVLDQE